MTKNLITTVLCFIISPISVFSQGWALSNAIKASEIEPKFSIVDNGGNSYILASFKDTIYNPLIISNGNADLVLLKLNSSGNLLWHKQIGGTGIDNAGSLAINDTELFVIINFQDKIKFNSTDSLVSKGSLDVGLCKFSTQNGDYISSVVIGTSNGASDSQVVLNAKIYNSMIVLAGNFTNTIYLGAYPNCDTLIANGFNTNFIAQTDLQGNIEWSKRILSSTNNCKVNKIALSENGYYFGGFYRGSLYFDVDTITSYTSGYNDNFLYKTNFTGDGDWVRRIYGSETENIQSVATDGYENVYVLGNYGSPTLYIDSTATLVKSHAGNMGNFDTYICKYNRSGILQWLILKGSPGKDIYNDFILRNNVIYATGYFTNQIIFNYDTLNTTGLANSDAFIAAFNQVGDPIAGVSIVGTGDYEDAGTIVNMDANSRAYVSGYYKSQQIQIGDQTYTSNNINKSDLFFAIYQQPFNAAITDERNVSCNGLNDGMLQVTPYFGKPPYTYSWSHNTGLDNPVADNLAAGTYTVTVTDDNDSIAYASATITQAPALAINDGITHVSCNDLEDGSIDITATGGIHSSGYSYFWTSLNGSGVEPLAEDQSGLSAGDYTVIIKDDNDCSASDTFTITQPLAISYTDIVVTSLTAPGYDNGAVSLTVGGGTSPYIFNWSGPGSFTPVAEGITGIDAAGLYTLSVTDDNGCTSDTTFSIIDDHTFTAWLSEKTDESCFGDLAGSATIMVANATGACDFTWTGDGSWGTNNIRTDMAAGNYTVIVTDLPSNNKSTVPVTIGGPLSGIELSVNVDSLHCNGDNSGVANIQVTNGILPYSFNWNNGYYTGEDLVNVPSGSYDLLVTDGNGCTADTTIIIPQPDAIVIDIDITDEIYCHGENTGSLSADISGGILPYSILWDDPGAQVDEKASDLFAGTYSVTVTDGEGCIKSNTEILEEPDPLALNTELTNPSCVGENDGSIIPDLTGGIPSFTYVWTNDVYQLINVNIPAGTYTLKVTDGNNCKLEQSYTLTDPDTVKIVSVIATDQTCSGHPDGTLTISATGGTGIYEYSSDGGSVFTADSVIISLTQGNYILRVRDENECTSDDYQATISKSEGCDLVIFDAFSPNNGDNKNDVWNIGNIENFPSCTIKIFNIWGITVFSSNGYAEPWDGTYDGKDLPSGTYYYVIDLGDGSEELSGAVSIVK